MLQPTTRRIAATSRTTQAIHAATTSIAPLPHRTALAPGRRFSQRPGGTRKTRSLVRPEPVLGALSVTGLCCYLFYHSQRRGAATAAMASSKLVPSNPSDVMVIRDVTPNVVTLSVPFLRYGFLAIGGRATVVRLSSGALAVFSPVALTPEVKAKLAAMGGELRYIVALDIEHHIFISQWAREFPGARIVGPEGLPEKRAKAAADGVDPMIGAEPFAVVFKAEDKKRQPREGPVVSDEFDADFASEFVDSHRNKELAFCYRPDRVLIEADLMFNLPATEQYSRVPEEARPKDGPVKRIAANAMSTAGDAMAAKRFIWHVASRADRAGFNESVRRIAAWDFSTIVPCHGETIVGDGKEVFRKVFQWHLEGEEGKK
ncbi:hypothetical protein RB601_006319 [Gaeumannomyces tritici]